MVLVLVVLLGLLVRTGVVEGVVVVVVVVDAGRDIVAIHESAVKD